MPTYRIYVTRRGAEILGEFKAEDEEAAIALAMKAEDEQKRFSLGLSPRKEFYPEIQQIYAEKVSE